MSESSELDIGIRTRIAALVAEASASHHDHAGEASARRRRHVEELLGTGLKLLSDGCDVSQIKLIENAVKEIRRSYRVFNRFRGVQKVSIFGSARTPEDHPDYIAARSFGQSMAAEHWMAITGAGDGIMKAGHEGPSRESSFGLSIRLPFETNANDIIAGDDKLISFKYFFTRKLMFVSHSDAVAVFPGGFGTMDEIFEVLTLIQTGKSPIVPIVLVEGADTMDIGANGNMAWWKIFWRKDGSARRILVFTNSHPVPTTPWRASCDFITAITAADMLATIL